MYKVGDTVVVSKRAYSVYDRKEKSITTMPIHPVECVYLGYTNLFEGNVVRLANEWHGEEAFLDNRKAVRVDVVQPVSKDGRYRKPFYTMIEEGAR